MEIDANGIINLKVESGDKEECLMITNDKGRLSADEISRCVEEAEEFDDYNTRLTIPSEVKLPVSYLN